MVNLRLTLLPLVVLFGVMGCRLEHSEEADTVRKWFADIPFLPPGRFPPGYVGEELASQIAWRDWVAEGRTIPNAEKHLLAMLEGERDSFVRGKLIRALAAVGGKECVPHLIEVLRSEANYWPTCLAAWALGYIGDKQALPALGEAHNAGERRKQECAENGWRTHQYSFCSCGNARPRQSL